MFNQMCGCQNNCDCDCENQQNDQQMVEQNTVLDVCQSSPVLDAFLNPSVQDSIVLQRVLTEDGECGPAYRCQTVTTSFDILYDRVIERLGVRLIDIEIDYDNDQVIEIYSDTSRQLSPLSKYLDNTDTRLSNPRIADPDGDGNQDVVWDIVDIDGNVLGTETFEILNTNTISVATGLSFDEPSRTLTLDQQNGGALSVVIPAGPDTDTISSVTGLGFNNSNRTLTLSQNVGGSQSVVIPDSDTISNVTALNFNPTTRVLTLSQTAGGNQSVVIPGDSSNPPGCTPETIAFPAFSPISISGSAGFVSGGIDPFTVTANPPASTLDTAPPNTALFCFSDASQTSHVVTFDFGQDVDEAIIWIRSSTGAASNFSNWSKAPDSVVNALNSVGGSSGEDHRFTNINSQTLTVNMLLAAGQRVCLEVKSIVTACP